mgnify:CR=1 FL=1
MVKKASVRVALSEPISPGKYLILLSGMEAEVEESWLAGVSDGAEAVVDSLFLPGVHLGVVHGIHGTRNERPAEHSLGIIETSSVAAAVLACDAALKEAPVSLLEMRLGKGIGGKGVFSLAGTPRRAAEPVAFVDWFIVLPVVTPFSPIFMAHTRVF